MRARDVVVSLAIVMASGCGDSTSASDGGTIDGGPRDTSDAASIADGSSSDASSRDASSILSDAQVDGGPMTSTTPLVYVGQSDGDFVVYALDRDSGELTMRSSARTGDFPAFAAMAADGRRMVVVLEPSTEAAGLVIAPGTGAITRVNSVSARGDAPTHVAIDPTGRHAFTANYGGHNVAMLPLAADGRLGEASDVENAGRNAHAVVVDRSGRWLLVPALGDDHVAIFEIDHAAGTLRRHGTHGVAGGAGPRHLVLDAAGTHAYLINERHHTVDVLSFDAGSGALAHLQTLSTLPPGAGSDSTAEIAITPDGRHVYASNRGHDSIAIFEVQGDGRLVARGHAMLEARTPRSMAIDPSGTFLIVGAMRSNVLVRFRIGADGALTRLGTTSTSGQPYYVGIFAIPDA